MLQRRCEIDGDTLDRRQCHNQGTTRLVQNTNEISEVCVAAANLESLGQGRMKEISETWSGGAKAVASAMSWLGLQRTSHAILRVGVGWTWGDFALKSRYAVLYC